MNVASPALLVATVVVPVSEAPAGARVATTFIPACNTALPPPSRTCTDGCWASVPPVCTVFDGWVVIVSCAGAPATRLITTDVAFRLPDEKPMV